MSKPIVTREESKYSIIHIDSTNATLSTTVKVDSKNAMFEIIVKNEELLISKVGKVNLSSPIIILPVVSNVIIIR